MAYMSQENKAKISKKVKPLLEKYGLKGSLSVSNHSQLCLTIKSGKIDFAANYFDAIDHYSHRIRVNHYHIDSTFRGIAAEALNALKEAMMEDNYDHSDIMTDYFCVGWYIDISIGKWDKPYVIK